MEQAGHRSYPGPNVICIYKLVNNKNKTKQSQLLTVHRDRGLITQIGFLIYLIE